MKLRNKKTGEIKDFALVVANSNVDDTTLTELNDEWEDVPTEEVWYLGERIGNYSMPKKEARKATEKILAWKRLKDKGFQFDRWYNDNEKYLGDFVIYAHTKDLTDIVDDLDLIFRR